MSNQFRTFQTVQNYEDALDRHGQWFRWLQGLKCACSDPDTMQPDPSCIVCGGRGRIYRNPNNFSILEESAKHDGQGRIYPRHSPIVSGSVTVYSQGTLLPLSATQPADGSYIQLQSPYPVVYRLLTVNYSFTPYNTVTSENSEVYGTNILRVIAARFNEKGKSFEGSVDTVTRVYNVTRAETYTVSSITKEYITLQNMGTWQSGDVLEVDYTYVAPFDFLMNGVTGRLRYEQPYVLDDADATLVTPYWAKPAPEDLLTAMAQEKIGQLVLDPSLTSGNDKIIAYHDLSQLMRVIDANGNDYTVGPGKNVEIFGRDELKWNITKPGIRYTAQFTYHPTYTALTNLHTLRNSENKAFVNRVSVKQYDRVHEKDTY